MTAEIPSDVREYAKGFDLEALAKASPAFTGTDAQKQQLGEFFQRAHVAGIPVQQAHKLAFEEWKGREAPPTAEALRADAIKHLGPNGPTMAKEVETAMVALERRQAFSDSERAVVSTLAQSGPGLGVLWRLVRAGSTGTALPGSHGRRPAGRCAGAVARCDPPGDGERPLQPNDPAYRRQIQDGLRGQHEAPGATERPRARPARPPA